MNNNKSRNLEMPENNQQPNNGEFLPAGDCTYGLSLLPENNPFEFQLTESNTYHVGDDGRQNHAMINTNGQVNDGGGSGNIYGLPSSPGIHSFQVSQLENNTYYPGVDGLQSLAMMNPGDDQMNSAAGGQINGLSSLSGNNPFQVLPREINAYNPVDGRRTLGMMNTNGRNENPSNVDPFYDFPLESEFSRLSMSTHPPIFTPPPSYGRRTVVGGGGDRGRIIPNNFTLGTGPYSQSQCSYGDLLHRMRIQSAAMGQNMDLYTQPRNNSIFDDDFDEIALRYGLNSNTLSNYDRRFSGETITYPTRPRTARIGSLLPFGYLNQMSLNRNGQRLDTNGSIEPNYYSSLLTSRLRPSFSSLEDLRGNIFMMAKDQQGCRFLQRKIEEGKPDHIHLIFSEVKDHIRELMVNQFGSCLIQKLFEVCSQEQMDELLLLVMQDEMVRLAICVDFYGKEAMKKLLEHLETEEQKSTAISCITRITVPLTKTVSGNDVIEHILKVFSSEDNRHILNTVADNCVQIATDRCGCCVIQKCVANAQGESLDRLVQEIIVNALNLSIDPYGNYVVQYIVDLKIPNVTRSLLNRLSGSYTQLSISKFGSNVVEKCVNESEYEEASRVIQELLSDPQWLTVIQNPYGNYVAQSALKVSKGAVRTAMVNFINHHYPFLNSHPHGKRVLALTRGNRNRG